MTDQALNVLFIDRDGTLVAEPEDYQVDALDKIRLLPGVIHALIRLKQFGYRFVMVSNQDGLGTDSFPTTDFERCQSQILSLFATQGIEFDEVLICPHFEQDQCNCRKPATGLLTRYLIDNSINKQQSAVIGDRATDVELADNLGIRSFLVAENGTYEQSWDGICNALMKTERNATVQRVTSETNIEVSIQLDSDSPVQINTGIGFFDHMLEQIARHAGIALSVRCEGDLHIDMHHSIEDTALCLGEALRKALGNKRGIARFGFMLPMDETEARVSIDLSGRPFFKFDGQFPASNVGELPTEMVPHFFRSFSDALQATLHMHVRGENTHHMVESLFKALGRVLRQACQIESDVLPSTKGTLG